MEAHSTGLDVYAALLFLQTEVGTSPPDTKECMLAELWEKGMLGGGSPDS